MQFKHLEGTDINKLVKAHNGWLKQGCYSVAETISAYAQGKFGCDTWHRAIGNFKQVKDCRINMFLEAI